MVDEVGAIAAARHVGRPVVTVAVDSIAFYSPIQIGNLVTLKASLNYVGRTSMEVGVRVEAMDVLTGEITHTNSAYLVYVALDENLQPVAVPPLVATTVEEERRMEEGTKRQMERLRKRKAEQRRAG
jgi:acyl-CoA hydrolase